MLRQQAAVVVLARVCNVQLVMSAALKLARWLEAFLSDGASPHRGWGLTAKHSQAIRSRNC